MSDKKHYEAIKDVHVNLDNRNHAIDEYGYGPLNPKEKNDDFWNEKAKLWKSPVEEAKKSRCYNCAAFNQTPKILKDMGDALGPVGDKIVEKANLGFCEFFYFKCAGDRTCDAWIVNGPLEEGIADKIGPFFRGFADNATAGGYKYARAGVDFVAKRTLNALGLRGGEKTTYGRELDQEKEKLSKDYEKEPLASAAGDIAGHALPYVPVIGGAVRAVKGAIGAAKDYADKVSPVADKLSRGLQEKKYTTIEEDAPANATGPNVPGTGDDPQAFPRGEPLKRYKKKTEKEQQDVSGDISLLRRATPMMEMKKLTISDKAIADAATKGDKALDDKYKYGTTKGGVSPLAFRRRQQGFGSMANFNSAKAAIISKRKGEGSKAQDTAIHKGWGKTVDQMPAPNPEKQSARKKLQNTPFYALSKDEQEKDTVLRKGVFAKEEFDKTGTFAGSQTFIVPTNIFHEAKLQKKRGKHWRTYIGEEDHWRHIREYAKKYPKKSIILQDERTGAMCYARYGKEKSLMEAPLLTDVGKKQKFNDETGQAVRKPRGQKIARIDADHDLHYSEVLEGQAYTVRNRKTGVVHGTVFGYKRKNSGTFEINATDSTGQGPKMHKVYRKILQSGHSTALVGKQHSVGGQRIWQNLSSEKNISVHGWRRGKPVNLDPKDPEETHVTNKEAGSDAAARDIYRTDLVASYVKRKTAKR
jgi:hypothetical protein